MKHTITAAQWKSTSKDYKGGSTRKGDAGILLLTSHGTSIVAVDVVKEMSSPCACIHCVERRARGHRD